MIASGVGVAIRLVRLPGLYLIDCEQWQAQIAHFPEQAIQRGLIDHRTSEDGCSVACVGEAHMLKLVGPPGIQVSLETYFVASRLAMIIC